MTDQIRSREDEAQLEAAFHLPDTHPLLQRLRLHEIIAQNESELILRRVLSRSGRHRVYVNGSLCPLRVLEELGGTLVDIHGQHEQQSLLATAKQLDALDAFGRLYELRGRYEQAYREWKELRIQLDALQSDAVDRPGALASDGTQVEVLRLIGLPSLPAGSGNSQVGGRDAPVVTSRADTAQRAGSFHKS